MEWFNCDYETLKRMDPRDLWELDQRWQVEAEIAEDEPKRKQREAEAEARKKRLAGMEQ